MVWKKTVRDHVIKHLAVLAVGAQDRSPDLPKTLLEIPIRYIRKVVEEAEQRCWDRKDRLQLLSLLSYDSRASVKAEVARSVVSYRNEFSLEELEPVLARVARFCPDSARSVLGDAVSGLISGADGCVATAFVCNWATRPEKDLRLTIAHVLRRPFPVVGADVCVEHLATDPMTRVQVAAIEAARARFSQSPGVYRRLLARESKDPKPEVRLAARRAALEVAKEAHGKRPTE